MRQVGAYTIVRELGRGSYGVVYEARQQRSGARVALKVLLQEDGADPEVVRRFTLEAQIASKLRHPGLVSVLDFGTHSGRPYLVMEFAEGATLSEMLKAGPLPPRDSAELVSDVAEALAYAHVAGVIHRDLKPGNIIIAPDGRPRVTDFGLARDRALSRSLTRTGDLLGTPVTMSPEQFRGDRDIDRRADVYALGATLYRCLTGRYPHQSRQLVELMHRVCHVQPVPPSQIEPKVSAQLDAVCLRALAKDPNDRYPDCMALANALRATNTGGPDRQAGSKAALVGAALGAFLALVALGFVALLPRGGSPDFAEGFTRLSGFEARAGDDPRAALDALHALEGGASDEQRVALREQSKRIAHSLLTRARNPTCPWEERVELLELVPEFDPEVSEQARHEALLQASTLANLLEAGEPPVPQALGLLRRLAGDDRALSQTIQQLESIRDWARLLERAVHQGREEPYASARARLDELRQDAQRSPARAEQLDLELARLARRRGRVEAAMRGLNRLAQGPGEHQPAAEFELLLTGWSLATWSDQTHAGFRAYAELHPTTRLGRVANAMGRVGGSWNSAPQPPEERRRDGEQALALALDVLAEDEDSVPALIALYRAQRQLGRGVESAQALTRASHLAPDDSLIFYCMTGLSRGYDGDPPPEVVELVRSARDRYLELTEGGDPTRSRTRTLARRARSALERGDHAAALRDYDAALAHRPFDARTQFGRGVAAAALQGPEAGVENWRLARALRPEPSRGSARTFAELVDDLPPDLAHLRPAILEAIDFRSRIEERVAAVPESARAELRSALELAYGSAPWAQVREGLRAALAAAPESAPLAREAARVYCGRDLYDEARQAIARARELDPRPADFELERLEAELLLRQGLQSQAREAYQRLAEADPDGVEGRCAAAQLALLDYAPQAAAELADRALELDPEHVPSLLAKSFALCDSDPTQASALAARARSLVRDLDTRIGLALVTSSFSGIADGSRAWVPGTRIAELQETSAGAGWLIPTARYLAMLGSGQARDLVRGAAAREPERPDLHALQGCLLLGSARATAADVAKHWERARALDPGYRFDPRDVRRYESRFPGDFERRFGEP